MIDSIGSGAGGASLSAVKQDDPVQAAKSEGKSAEQVSPDKVAPASLQSSEGEPSANSEAAVVQISAEARALAGG